MSYKKIDKETFLRKVRIKMYNADTDTSTTIRSLGNCVKAGDLLSIVSRLDNVLDFPGVNDAARIEVMLSYVVEDEEVNISFINTTSDVSDEWLCVPINSKIVSDSIMLGTDLVTTTNDAWVTNNKGFKSVEEFYISLKAKNVLIEALVSRFVDNQFYTSYVAGYKHLVSLEEDTKKHSNIYNKLKYIPTSHLRDLIGRFDEIKDGCEKEKTVSAFLCVAAKAGVLNFQPYITRNSYGHPTLVLKYNRYVHLFRGYQYQCSYMADGVGEYSSASVRVDAFRRFFGRHLGNSRLLKMLYYMNLIACCKELDVFTKLLRTNPSLVDEFMKQSTCEIFDEYDVTYLGDMVGMINYVSTGVPDSEDCSNEVFAHMLDEPLEVLRIPANDTADVCRVKVYDTTKVGVEFYMDESVQEVLFTLPNWAEGYSYDKLSRYAEADDMTIEEYTQWKSSMIYESQEVYCSLVVFALNMCGCVANFMTVHPVKKSTISNLRALNDNNVKVCETLNDVDVKRIVELRKIK